jgi:hypothetical protein
MIQLNNHTEIVKALATDENFNILELEYFIPELSGNVTKVVIPTKRAIMNFNNSLESNDITLILKNLRLVNAALYNLLSRIYDPNESGQNKKSRSLPLNIEDESCITSKECAPLHYLNLLNIIPHDVNDNDSFVTLFTQTIWICLKWLGLHTSNTESFANKIVEIINSKTRSNYITIRCPTHSYTCGRAIYPLTIHDDKKPRIAIFNSESEYSDAMSIATLSILLNSFGHKRVYNFIKKYQKNKKCSKNYALKKLFLLYKHNTYN